MIRYRTIIAACTFALLAGCSTAKTPQNAAAQTDSVAQAGAPAQTTSQPRKRPLMFQPVDRARAASDSMAARAARMNAATDSIIH